MDISVWCRSIVIAAAATVLTSLTAIPTAYFLGRRKFFGKTLLEGLLILPLVLPPTVVGWGLLVILGNHGLQQLGIDLLFKVYAAVLASALVSFPLVLIPARAAFASLPPEFFDEACISGASRWQTFLFVALPIARRGLFAGLLLGFGRALGEFGATVMVVSISDRTMTLPTLIYFRAQTGDYLNAWPYVAALSLTSLSLIAWANHARWFAAE